MKNATSAGLVRRATTVAARVSFRQLEASSREIALEANSASPAGCSGPGTRGESRPVTTLGGGERAFHDFRRDSGAIGLRIRYAVVVLARRPRDSRVVVTQPTGTVTLLFTDIEGSTRLLERLGATAYGEALTQGLVASRASAPAPNRRAGARVSASAHAREPADEPADSADAVPRTRARARRAPRASRRAHGEAAHTHRPGRHREDPARAPARRRGGRTFPAGRLPRHACSGDEGGEPIVATLERDLREKELLLLLDNFEHLESSAPI